MSEERENAVAEHLEPVAAAMIAIGLGMPGAVEVSTAISLKRIADSLEGINDHLENIRRRGMPA